MSESMNVFHSCTLRGANDENRKGGLIHVNRISDHRYSTAVTCNRKNDKFRQPCVQCVHMCTRTATEEGKVGRLLSCIVKTDYKYSHVYLLSFFAFVEIVSEVLINESMYESSETWENVHIVCLIR